MIRVLFVCLGNICRSPMAEAVFQHKVALAELSDTVKADSAGTGDWHVGAQPHQGTRNILTDKQIAYEHCARQINEQDLNEFDSIITMDEANRRNVGRIGRGRAKVIALLDFAPHFGIAEVPDPYLTGNFEEVYQLVDAATDGLLAAIRQEQEL